jgi:hypothetical protein
VKNDNVGVVSVLYARSSFREARMPSNYHLSRSSRVQQLVRIASIYSKYRSRESRAVTGSVAAPINCRSTHVGRVLALLHELHVAPSPLIRSEPACATSRCRAKTRRLARAFVDVLLLCSSLESSADARVPACLLCRRGIRSDSGAVKVGFEDDIDTRSRGLVSRSYIGDI